VNRMQLGSPARWVQLLGVGHLGIGAVLYRREIRDVVRSGVVGTVGDHGPVATAWWFLVVAPATWAAGRSMRALERGEPASAALRPVGVVLGVTGALGAVVMPRSPFWLLAAAGTAAAVRPGGAVTARAAA